MNHRIRDAEPRDIDEIVQLCAELAEFEQADFSAAGKAERLATLLFSDSPRLFCLVVENEDEIVGYATFMRELSTWDAAYYVHMDCLFLRPHARNFGIGKQLIREIARRAQLLECKQIQWQTPEANERGINFYRRLGAGTKTKVRFYLDETTITKLAE
jgi:GNAT superfamily N-acetyltransferase